MNPFGKKAWVPTTWPGMLVFLVGGWMAKHRRLQFVGIPIAWLGIVLVYLGILTSPYWALLALSALLN